MANSGYLGGDVSMAERHRLRDKYLTPIAHRAVDKGLRCQCRCGGTRYVKWRGRWYCPADGRWVREFVGDWIDDANRDVIARTEHATR